MAYERKILMNDSDMCYVHLNADMENNFRVFLAQDRQEKPEHS
jgi:hypothetical protein